MIVSLIAAMSRNRVIGVDNKLPWKLPEDLKRFREITTGHPVIMGRRTYESIGRALPNRTNVIISRNPGYRAPGAITVRSLDDAFALFEGREEEVFVIGGGEIYSRAMPRAHRLYLTLIDRDYEGDTVFPAWPEREFDVKSRDDRNGGELPFSFVVLERRP